MTDDEAKAVAARTAMREAVEAMARAMARRNYPSGTDRDIDMMWEGWVEDAKTALAALTASGYAVVPVEPTEAIIEAGYRAYSRKADDIWSVTPTEEPEAGGGAMGYAYRAMLAAANKEPNDD